MQKAYTIRKVASNAHKALLLIPDKFAIKVGRVKITTSREGRTLVRRAGLEVSAPETHDLGYGSGWFRKLLNETEGESFRRSQRRQISREERISL
jgi:hypothetical protein